MATVITVFSGKGGVGKSFAASNIACGFTSLKCRTLLIDFAFGVRNDDAILGLTDSVLYNIGDVISAQCKLEEAVVHSDKEYIPDFLASSVSESDSELRNATWKIIRSVSDEYDFVVLDCSSPVGAEFDICCAVSDILLAVTCEDGFSVGNTALRILKNQSRLPENRYLIINKAEITNGENDICAEDIIDETGLKLIGIIPYDEAVLKSMSSGEPIVCRKTPASVALRNICRRILGENVSFSMSKKTKSVF